MLIKFIILSVYVCCFSLHLLAQDRGMRPVQVPVDGTPVTLYENSYALLIGVSDYTSGWSHLPGVQTEIAQVKSALLQNGFQVEEVLNPTTDQLYKAFTDFIGKYGQGLNNRLLFFFAGHGYTLKTAYGEELGYIVPVNAPNPNYDPSGFQNQAMEMAQVEIYARRLQAKHAMFIFDACFAGTLFSNTRAIPEIISYKTALPVRQFITSGSANETVPDQSVFAGQFVRALAGDADFDKNGYITGSELGEYLQTTVVNYTRNMQHPQYGKIRSPNLDKGDFVFPVSSANTQESRSVTPQPVPVPPSEPVVQQQTAVSRTPIEEVKEDDGFSMVFVEGGTFLMGNKRGGKGEKPQHPVKLNDFHISAYEITRGQWREIMGDDPSLFSFSCDDCPVDNVSWEDVHLFIEKLNAKSGHLYRLPTEAEWEYAARGGNKSRGNKYAGGSDLSHVAWIKTNSSAHTHPVGKLKPNELGLYDMSGNVLEWCLDWFDEDYYTIKGTQVNPQGPPKGSKRVARGGSFKYDGDLLGVSARFDLKGQAKYSDTGFRLVRIK